MRRMRGVKLVDKMLTKDLMQMLDLNETIGQLAKADSVHCYGHVLRKDKKNFLRRALDLKVRGTRKNGRPKKTWLKQMLSRVENESDANNRTKWRLEVNTISSKMR